LFGFPLPILSDPNWYTPNGMLLISPSAFFLIGIFIWVLRTVYPEQQEKE
jgi:Na+-transporting NADH:ubiquinone oxidoreductase subunit D